MKRIITGLLFAFIAYTCQGQQTISGSGNATSLEYSKGWFKANMGMIMPTVNATTFHNQPGRFFLNMAGDHGVNVWDGTLLMRMLSSGDSDLVKTWINRGVLPIWVDTVLTLGTKYDVDSAVKNTRNWASGLFLTYEIDPYSFHKSDSNNYGGAITLSYYNLHKPGLSDVLAVNNTLCSTGLKACGTAIPILLRHDGTALISLGASGNLQFFGRSLFGIGPVASTLLFSASTGFLTYDDGNQTTGYVLTCMDASGTIKWQKVTDSTLLSTKAYRQKGIDSITANFIPNSEKGAANGVATLDASGQIPSSQIPELFISHTYVVGSVSAMLALSDADTGDVCIRTDSNITFILRLPPASNYANWSKILTPVPPVTSVNGYTGNVDIDADDVDEGIIHLYYTDARVRAALSAGYGMSYNATTGAITADSTLLTTNLKLYKVRDSVINIFPQYAPTNTATFSGLTTVTSLNATTATITNLTATNTIAGSISGNAATVTTNANLTGPVTSIGNATTITTVNSNTSSTGSSTAIPVITANAAGQITSLTTTVVIAPASTLSGNTLAAGITSSSLTSLGTITSLNATAATITTLNVTTQTSGDNSTLAASTAYVKNQGYSTTTGTVTSVGLVAGTGTSITGTSPINTSGAFTVSATGGLTAGTGISLGGAFPTYTVTNSSPDRTVTLASGTGATVTGTYPTFTVSATGTSTVTVGGSNTQMLYNSSGTIAGTPNVVITNGYQTHVSTVTAVAAPSAGNIIVYSNNQTGVDELHVVPSVGAETILQNSVHTHLMGRLFSGGGSTINVDGQFTGSNASLGSAVGVAKTYDGTNLLPNYNQTKQTSAGSTNSSAGFYINASLCNTTIGNNTYGAGTKLTMTFGFPVYTSTQRFFAGYQASAAGIPSAIADPSSFINMIGIGKDAADGTLQVMSNDGSGTATKTNTSITPNVNDVYRVTIFIPSNGNSAYVTLEDITKSSVTKYNSGLINADLPSSGTKEYLNLYGNSGATSTSAVVSLILVVEEQF